MYTEGAARLQEENGVQGSNTLRGTEGFPDREGTPLPLVTR